tara:strand:+ start:710 stop:913 length:204 start_codon:yes stop_codon:yes gene_type:complete
MNEIFCSIQDCEYDDEPMREGSADYRVIGGKVICEGCYEDFEDARQWSAANAEEAEGSIVSRILSQR